LLRRLGIPQPCPVDIRLSIGLSYEIVKRLDSLARITGKTKSHLAREAILESISDMEAAARAEGRLKKFESDGEEAIPSAEIRRQLGLD
jgi:predicted DNA-binding protein